MAIEYQKPINITLLERIQRMRSCATYLSGQTFQTAFLEIKNQFEIIQHSIFAESIKIEFEKLLRLLIKIEECFFTTENEQKNI
ncbi:hypothetical protein WJT86_08295 [Microvirga sp. W0021]|uniref:Uncharacterized protein n=1 Tax=Hohaiivirga grylli TaxID=3133970 RepID=A0ABV0BNE7_9HYPH